MTISVPHIRHCRHRRRRRNQNQAQHTKYVRWANQRATAPASGGIGGTGALIAFTADAGTDLITSAGHGFTVATVGPIRFETDGTLPAGLTGSPDFYYLRVNDANTFSVHLTRREAGLNLNAIDITDAGTGSHTFRYRVLYRIVDDYLKYMSAPEFQSLTDVDDVPQHDV